jgi:hypothetical protein
VEKEVMSFELVNSEVNEKKEKKWRKRKKRKSWWQQVRLKKKEQK